MPLIIISGFPCCGKTTFSKKLKQFLEIKGAKKVVLINEESENVNKRLGYREASNEKKTRGSLKSAVDHHLGPETFVIVDSMNYIKGYRYELFCISKSLRTPHCCIWIEADEVSSTEWNSVRAGKCPDEGYDPEILTELRRRFEAPIEKNRWDFPLFRVLISTESILQDPKSGEDNCIDGGKNPPLISSGVNLVAIEEVHCEDQKPETPSSTKGQVDIRCLAIDKNFKMSFRSEAATDTIARPVKSSWRPKIKQETDASKSRAFTTLSCVADNAPGAESACVEESFCPTSALSISGSVRISIPDVRHQDEESIMHQAYLHLTDSTQMAAPNSSTISVPRVNADLLHELDRSSQDITQRIICHQADNVEGTPLIFQDFDRTLAFHRHVGLAELQRHRRQFVRTNSNMNHGSLIALGASFIDSLAMNL